MPTGFRGMISTFIASDVSVRPIGGIFLISEFSIFKLNTIPYHLVDAALLGITVAFLYLALRELKVPFHIAFSIAVVFGMLPHYSTDRFWVISQQATLCLTLALLGIYALQRSQRDSERHRMLWMMAAVVVFVLSILSYEVAAGLIAAALVHSGWRLWQSNNGKSKEIARIAGIGIVTCAIAAVGLVKARMQTRMVYHHHFLHALARIGGATKHATTQAVLFNFWTYGLHMPSVLASLARQQALTFTAITVSVCVATVVAIYFSTLPWLSKVSSWRACVLLAISGLLVFLLGYLLFFAAADKDFSVGGMDNRITIASAVGASFIEVAFCGIACCLSRPVHRKRVFGIVVGLVCGVNCLVTAGIANFWIVAAEEQRSILNSLSRPMRDLPKGSTLLLDGFCRFLGPGVVFETDWDITGALQIQFHDFSLVADVVSPNLHVDDNGIDTTMYNSPEAHYPYGPSLYVYNLQKAILVPLASKQAALDYFKKMNPTGDSGCPVGQEGIGTKVF